MKLIINKKILDDFRTDYDSNQICISILNIKLKDIDVVVTISLIYWFINNIPKNLPIWHRRHIFGKFIMKILLFNNERSIASEWNSFCWKITSFTKQIKKIKELKILE